MRSLAFVCRNAPQFLDRESFRRLLNSGECVSWCLFLAKRAHWDGIEDGDVLRKVFLGKLRAHLPACSRFSTVPFTLDEDIILDIFSAKESTENAVVEPQVQQLLLNRFISSTKNLDSIFHHLSKNVRILRLEHMPVVHTMEFLRSMPHLVRLLLPGCKLSTQDVERIGEYCPKSLDALHLDNVELDNLDCVVKCLQHFSSLRALGLPRPPAGEAKIPLDTFWQPLLPLLSKLISVSVRETFLDESFAKALPLLLASAPSVLIVDLFDTTGEGSGMMKAFADIKHPTLRGLIVFSGEMLLYNGSNALKVIMRRARGGSGASKFEAFFEEPNDAPWTVYLTDRSSDLGYSKYWHSIGSEKQMMIFEVHPPQNRMHPVTNQLVSLSRAIRPPKNKILYTQYLSETRLFHLNENLVSLNNNQGSVVFNIGSKRFVFTTMALSAMNFTFRDGTTAVASCQTANMGLTNTIMTVEPQTCMTTYAAAFCVYALNSAK